MTSSEYINDQSPTGLPLFDAVKATEARDAAILAVGRNASPESRAAIYAAILRVASQLELFSTDAVWAEVPSEYRTGVDRRLIGSLMIAAARDGHIERLPGVFSRSNLVVCHRRPKQVWRSRRTLR